MDYKATLNLPETAVPDEGGPGQARAGDPRRSGPRAKLYERILERRKSARPTCSTTARPTPTATSTTATSSTRSSRTSSCKYRTMAGHYVEYKPGWDCHGLPIELARAARARRQDRRACRPSRSARACHDYAMKWVGVQRDEFKRLGVFGTWERPYLTLEPRLRGDHRAPARRVRAQGPALPRRSRCTGACRTRPRSPRPRSSTTSTHTSPSIYVKFATPEAGPLRGHLDDHAVDAAGQLGDRLPPELRVRHGARRRRALHRRQGSGRRGRRGLQARRGRPARAVRRRALRARSTRRAIRSSIAQSRFVPADYVTLEQGTGLVHTAPGHGADDYVTGKKYGLPVDAPVDDGGDFTDGPWKGEFVFKANPKIVGAPGRARRAALAARRRRSRTRTRSAGAARTRSSSAPPSSGSRAWTATTRARARSRCAEIAPAPQWIPPWGENRIAA